MVVSCSLCGALLQLPPHPINPKQVIICVQCNNATLAKARRRESSATSTSGRRRVAPVAPTPPTPSTPRTPQQPDRPPMALADLDNHAFARWVAVEAMKLVHPAHKTAELGGLGADFVRIAPEGGMLAPASMQPPSYRPSKDGRHYSERGEILVSPVSSTMSMPPPPPPSATPISHKYFGQTIAPPVAQPSRVPTQAPVPAPPRSQPPPIPRTPLRASMGSSASVPNIRRSAPAASVTPPHLIRPPPGQPVTLQHFHAAVSPSSSNDPVQGWDPQAAGRVRVCETSGCNAILSPKHLWRVCGKCLAAVDPCFFPSSTNPASAQEKSAHAPAGANAEPAPGGEPSKPRLRVATEPSPPPGNPTAAGDYHVLPMSASSQMSPSVQTGPPPIARSRRSASVEVTTSPVVLGPQKQPSISIPSLFSQLASQAQRARTKEHQTPAAANPFEPSHYIKQANPVRHPLMSPDALQQLDTNVMLQRIESLVEEQVHASDTQAQTKRGPFAVSQVHHTVERIRGGVGSSPIDTFSKPEPKPTLLPLPRNMKRSDASSKRTNEGALPTVIGGSAEQPIALDNGEDVPMHPQSSSESPSQAGQQIVTQEGTKNGDGLSDVVMNDAATVAEPAHDSVEEASKTSVSAPNATDIFPPVGSTHDAVQVKTEEPAEPPALSVAEQSGDVQMPAESTLGDTSDEDETPLSVITKAKHVSETTDDEKPAIQLSVKPEHRQSSSSHTSTPLRIRIRSLRKSRIDTEQPAFSAPDSPSRCSSPISPTSLTGTPWDSDLSDLTPLEDSTDEGESEIDEPQDGEEERPKLKIKLKIPKSFEARRSRLRTSRQEEKSPSTCSIRRCQNLLAVGYRYKLCDVCREYNRRIQRRARLEQEERDPEARLKRQLVDLSLYPPNSRICTGKGCRTVIPPEGEYKWRMCAVCRRELRQKDKYAAIFEELPNGRKRARESDGLDLLDLQYPDDCDDGFPFVDRTPDAYRYLDELIQTLEMRFRAFFTAQLQYIQFKVAKGIDVSAASPTVFSFNGEYSIVANPAGGAVDLAVKVVVSQIGTALGLQFNPVGVFMGPEASVVSQFSCTHEVQMPLPPMQTSDPSAANGLRQVLARRMMGELEVNVAWDRRHKYFPGQRIQIRFRLLS
ncbi:hypothetical protein DAEQUDRAFT_188533 [Daedalea quercina L-15889]|uniref:Uncharacterized protein n=1 Tax=Daedalea quercina L-15889 TaxID=1314783 RepID=A0A165U344_9APHY|nr:hypothetical protein DAEQUDRAFT_188533 [Daedalea quercina L-15889]